MLHHALHIHIPLCPLLLAALKTKLPNTQHCLSHLLLLLFSLLPAVPPPAESSILWLFLPCPTITAFVQPCLDLVCASPGVAAGAGQCLSPVLALLGHLQCWGSSGTLLTGETWRGWSVSREGNGAGEGTGAPGEAEGTWAVPALGWQQEQGSARPLCWPCWGTSSAGAALGPS